MKTERRTSNVIAPVVLRLGREEDTPALRRLACLDSAISLHSGRVVADPFQPTEDLVALLRARLTLLRGTSSGAALGTARRLLRAVA